ncbi:MAG: NAD-binding protein [Solirubrobacteraceae bacterium]
MSPSRRPSPLFAVLPWHREARGLRSWWRGRPFAHRAFGWGTLAFGVLGFAFGMVGFLRLHVQGTPDMNLGEALYDTLSLYTLTLNVPGGTDPGVLLWIAAFAAPLTTARVLFTLTRDQVSRFAIRRILRGHTIVAGGGFRGTFLAEKLAAAGELVVLVDLSDQGAGMAGARRHDVWPLVGDATAPEVLRRAGLSHAARLVAMTSDDYVTASIAAAAVKLPDPHPEVFVHIDDPAVARIVDSPLRPGGRPPVVFSTASRAAAAAIDRAADAAFDHAEEVDHRASIVIFGDETVIDAMILELHRRWEMAVLGGADRTLQPLVTVFAPNATARVAALRNRHGLALDEIDLVAHDIDMDFGTSLDPETTRNLRATLPLDDVWVVDRGPLSALRLALSVSRIIGSAYTVRLLSEGSIDELTQAVETQTIDDDGVADILPECLVELSLGEATLDDGRRAARLAYADGLPRDADDATKTAAIDAAQAHLDRAGSVIDEPTPVATNWHADVHDALALPDPAVFIRAGLRVDALTARTASVAGPALIRRALSDEHAADPEPVIAAAFTYYARLAASITDPDSRLFDRLLADIGSAPGEAHRLKEDITAVLELRRTSLRLQAQLDGRDGPAARPGAAPAAYAMVAGGPRTWNGPGGAPSAVVDALADAVDHPRWDATLFTGDDEAGAAAVVGAVAARTGMPAVAYLPAPVEGTAAAIPAGFAAVQTGERGECTIGEPLRAWRELLGADVDPRKVPVVVYPGGARTASEVALAVAMGAPVALVDAPAPDAEQTLQTLYDDATNVAPLPNDSGALRAFLREFDPHQLPDDPGRRTALVRGQALLAAVREGWEDGERQPLRLLTPRFEHAPTD